MASDICLKFTIHRRNIMRPPHSNSPTKNGKTQPHRVFQIKRSLFLVIERKQKTTVGFDQMPQNIQSASNGRFERTTEAIQNKYKHKKTFTHTLISVLGGFTLFTTLHLAVTRLRPCMC